MTSGDFLDLPLHEFLDAVASEEPTPGGGSAAALAVTMSAALSAMVAKASGDWVQAGSVVAQAERLRKRAAPLAQRDAEAYEGALGSTRLPDRVEPGVRDAAVGAAMDRAAELPLQIVEAAADAASLAELVAERGAQERRGDAVAAALLAEAGARAAAVLVAVNLTMKPNDERIVLARELARAASEAATRAFRSIES